MPSMAETFRELQAKVPTPAQQWVDGILPEVQAAIQAGRCKNRFTTEAPSNLRMCEEIVRLLKAEPYNFGAFALYVYGKTTIHISW